MSTKRITRAFSESGHDSSWNHLCYTETRRNRRIWKQYMEELKNNPDQWIEHTPDAVIKAGSGHWDERHDSRASPIERWLVSQVGRQWDEIFSDLCHMTKTGGRSHRLKELLLRQVNRDSKNLNWHGHLHLYIDEVGALQQMPRTPRRNRQNRQGMHVDTWMNDRLIGQVGETLFWFVPKYVDQPVLAWTKDKNLVISHWERDIFSHRQDQRLTQTEITFFATLPAWQREKILKDSPVHKTS
ncbi:hypothetical protein HQ487_01665 [Candidatus Uhrbacteria bacterium]|nr:hypothetical protein [Candidatus Uhrbacteria bacterium]